MKKYEYVSAAKRNPAAIASFEDLGECVSGTGSVESEVESRQIESTINKFLWRSKRIFVLKPYESFFGST